MLLFKGWGAQGGRLRLHLNELELKSNCKFGFTPDIWTGKRNTKEKGNDVRM